MSKLKISKSQVDSWKAEFDTLNETLSKAESMEYGKISKQISDLQGKITLGQKYLDLVEELESSQELAKTETDVELKEMATAEVLELEKDIAKLEKEIEILLIPKDPDEEKNAILEIRAGTGGDEAAIFAADLYRMYLRYIENIGLDVEQYSINHSEQGGIKEVILKVVGDGAYGAFKFESGTHRVQRVPVTETSGRIHTSAATVAVLPEATDIEVKIDPSDLKVEVMRSSGPGGQSVNTTDSRVQITHIPTGIIVVNQDSKSQIKNRKAAMEVLQSRLYEMEKRKKQEEEAQNRKEQVGTGDRSGKIRTYNYPQDRITDHRIKKSWKNIQTILAGDLADVIASLTEAELNEKIQQAANAGA